MPLCAICWLNIAGLGELVFQEFFFQGYMVHLGMVNKADFQPTDDIKIMNFGNKITILTGDFLLAKASVGLSQLDNAEVVDIIAGIIGDIVEGEVLKDYKTQSAF